MSMAAFDYVRPAELPEAIEALASPGSRALGGGHHLLTLLKRGEATAERLVDLSGLRELRGIGVDDDGCLRIGASTTLTQLLADPLLRGRNHAPEPYGAIVDAVSALGDRQSRNRVTVGGQLACGRVGNDLAAALLVLGTEIMLCGPQGRRTVALGEMWPESATLALGPAELIVGIRLEPARYGSGYARMTDRATLEAVCGVAVAVPGDGWRGMAHCRVAATGLESRPLRVAALERALAAGAGLAELGSVPDAPGILDDRRAGASYRRHMAGVLAGRAASRALDRAPMPVPS